MKSQSGVAMAIVLWFLAAMSLLVSGIVYEARADVKLAQAHSARAKASAAGDGAVHLTMAALRSNDSADVEGVNILRTRFVVGSHPVEVELVPVAGLIDLNSAPKQLLQALFEVNAGLDAGDAQVLADNLVRWRLNTFFSPEDFLQVEGASRAILDAVRDSIYAGATAGGRLDLKSAPESVLLVASKGSPDRVASVQAQRESAAAVSGGKKRANGKFRADAKVTVGDRVWLRRAWVSTERASQGSLPWMIVRSEAARVHVAG
ncbi:MAG: hypothetical protein ABJK25_11155 [Halieaceae bacterium]